MTVDSAFTPTQYQETYPRGVEHYFWHVARHRIVFRELCRVTGTGEPPKKVLEIGCGRGVVLRYLRSKGVDCVGTELSPVPVDTDLAPYIVSDCDCFNLPSEMRREFDCLMLLDVIEHLPEPVAFMRRLRESFPAARVIVVTVPARPELWSNYDTYYGHFRRYTVESAADELTQAGFAAVRARYIFHGLYPVMLALAKFSGGRFTTTRAPTRKLLHSFMGLCFFAESLIIPSRVWGTSVLCTARLA